MPDDPSLRPESRYGMPGADQLLFNRDYIVGYSYLFRQPRWALELIDPENSADEVDRDDSFREDLRIPEMFRATLADYNGSGFDRGHLVSSADRLESRVKNSETFLLSNMAPQKPKFNRGVWKELESATRKLAARKDIVEVYVICGPLFDISKTFRRIGDDVIVPHEFFKSILAENTRGKLKLWTFSIPNQNTKKELGEFCVPTAEVEFRSGLLLWDRLRGEKIEKLKTRKERMWRL